MENSLDSYKISLGLPPAIKVKLDDALSGPFQLTAAELEKLQEDLDKFFAERREMEQAPPLTSLESGFAQLKLASARLFQLTANVEADWRDGRICQRLQHEPAQVKREQTTVATFGAANPEFRKELEKTPTELQKDTTAVGLYLAFLFFFFFFFFF